MMILLISSTCVIVNLFDKGLDVFRILEEFHKKCQSKVRARCFKNIAFYLLF